MAKIRKWDEHDYKTTPDHKYSWFVASGMYTHHVRSPRHWWPSKWAAEQHAANLLGNPRINNEVTNFIVAQGVVRVGPTAPPIKVTPL